MADNSGIDSSTTHAGKGDVPELELSNEDILDAMQHISGYLDISAGDFREIYHLAHRHALSRLFGNVRAGNLMRSQIEPLHPQMPLDQAAALMARQQVKSLPVVTADNRVVGILTETDFLRRLEADTLLALLLRLVNDISSFSHRCHETPVTEAMTATPVTIDVGAGFFEIVSAFRRHEGRSMPVVGADGDLRGLLFRKDFMKAFHLEELL